MSGTRALATATRNAQLLESGDRAGVIAIGGVLQLLLQQRQVLFLHLDFLPVEEDGVEAHAQPPAGRR